MKWASSEIEEQTWVLIADARTWVLIVDPPNIFRVTSVLQKKILLSEVILICFMCSLTSEIKK
jgi:hypothetical protein